MFPAVNNPANVKQNDGLAPRDVQRSTTPPMSNKTTVWPPGMFPAVNNPANVKQNDGLAPRDVSSGQQPRQCQTKRRSGPQGCFQRSTTPPMSNKTTVWPPGMFPAVNNPANVKQNDGLAPRDVSSGQQPRQCETKRRSGPQGCSAVNNPANVKQNDGLAPRDVSSGQQPRQCETKRRSGPQGCSAVNNPANVKQNDGLAPRDVSSGEQPRQCQTKRRSGPQECFQRSTTPPMSNKTMNLVLVALSCLR